jgi:hypothetical protein
MGLLSMNAQHNARFDGKDQSGGTDRDSPPSRCTARHRIIGVRSTPQTRQAQAARAGVCATAWGRRCRRRGAACGVPPRHGLGQGLSAAVQRDEAQVAAAERHGACTVEGSGEVEALREALGDVAWRALAREQAVNGGWPVASR